MMGSAFGGLPPPATAVAAGQRGCAARWLPVPGARLHRTPAVTATAKGSGGGSGSGGSTPGSPNKRASVSSSSAASCATSITVTPASSKVDGSPASTASSASTSKTQPQPRQRCIPPLPYWCEAVAVVGLPGGQLLFRFLTPTQTTAARRQLLPETPYGRAALKLAVVPDERIQAMLDKWQYAVAQQEVEGLEVRSMLWQSYKSAAITAASSSIQAVAAAGMLALQVELAQTQRTLGAKRVAKEQQRLKKLERKRLARAARKVKAKASGGAGASARKAVLQGARSTKQQAAEQQVKTKKRQAVEEQAAQQQASSVKQQVVQQQQQAGSAGQQAQPAVPLRLAAAAAGVDWEVCTVRGLPDGTTIFCFGDNNDAQQDGDAAGSNSLARRKARRRRLQAEAMQRFVEGQQFSSALRLGSLFPDIALTAAQKLERFAEEWGGGDAVSSGPSGSNSSSNPLTASLYPTHQKALGRVLRRAAAVEAASAALAEAPAADAGAPQQQQQQRQQAEKKQRSASAGAAAAAGSSRQQQQEAATAAKGRQQQQSGKRTQTASSSSADKAQQADVENEWQVELLSRPQWQAQASTPVEEQRGSAEAAHASGSSAAAQSRQRRWMWGVLAALAACAAQVAAACHRLAAQLGAAALAAYRLLPVPFRSLFWPSWPPQWGDELHVSTTLASMLASTAAEPGKLSDRLLDEAGFDSQGRTTAPLADLERWRVERLTLCSVGDMDLYRTAFSHKSALLPEERLQKSYERLEFLGDGVLTLTTRSLLMQRRPGSDEGEMTKLQGLLVSGVAAARYAEWLGLDRFVVLEAKAMREAAQHTPAVLADAFEALLGALYLDQGFEAARGFCTRVLDACVNWEQLAVATDWKGMLSGYAAKSQKPQPRYAVRATSQREYKAGLALTWWEVDVAFQGGVMGTGGSFDKKRAEQAAARQALRRLGEPV